MSDKVENITPQRALGGWSEHGQSILRSCGIKTKRCSDPKGIHMKSRKDAIFKTIHIKSHRDEICKMIHMKSRRDAI